MSAAVSQPWSSALSGASARLGEIISSSSAGILTLHQRQADVCGGLYPSGPRESGSGSSSRFTASNQDQPSSCSHELEKRLPNVADWKDTLDLVTGMADVAGDQKKDLEEQTRTQQRALEDLRRELNLTQQRLRASELRAREHEVRADLRLQSVQSRLDAQVREVRAETETRVRAIRARNADLIRAAEERVRTANLRARTAEGWLRRIDTAAKNLLLNGHMSQSGNP